MLLDMDYTLDNSVPLIFRRDFLAIADVIIQWRPCIMIIKYRELRDKLSIFNNGPPYIPIDVNKIKTNPSSPYRHIPSSFNPPKVLSF